MSLTTHTVNTLAGELGFNLAGVIPAEPSPHLDHYLAWITAGMHGNMGYLARPDRQARRRDLTVIVPGVRSMVLVGLDYRAEVPESLLSDPARGRIASYAWQMDYHDLMVPRLQQFAERLQAAAGARAAHKVYVDTGAILERSHAQQAGMGFIGKNTMLIHPRRGSYFFLGEILTTLVFDDYSTPQRETMCGSCVRCLEACPTDAFPRPYVLDARRCISYHTIENKGYIAHGLRTQFGNWVYGCDVCQAVCPWQRFSKPTHVADFRPQTLDHAAPPLIDLLQLTDAAFKARYQQSPIGRIKRARLVRNACIAAGNWGDARALPHLEALMRDDSPLVRAHALWGYAQIDGGAGVVRQVYEQERDPDARRDMAQTIAVQP